MKRTSRKTVEDRIIERLRGFTNSLEEGDIAGRFAHRRIVLDLQPGSYDAKRVKQTRGLLSASDVIFAQLLGVSLRTVRAWEQGSHVPSDIACRFMDEIQRNPDYWRRRIRDASRPKEMAS